MKLIRFYSDDELSDIRVSSSEETVFEVMNLFTQEQRFEDAIRDMIKTKNKNQRSHVDELRLDFNRIFRKKELKSYTRLGFFSFTDSANYKKDFSVDTIVNIKNEQRYLNACFTDYMILTNRFNKKEPYLFASLRNGYYYLLNADDLPDSNWIRQSMKNLKGWIKNKISFKTSTK